MLFKYYTANTVELDSNGGSMITGAIVWRMYMWRSPVYALEEALAHLDAHTKVRDVRRIK